MKKMNKYIKELTVKVVVNCGWGLPGTVITFYREGDGLYANDRWGRKTKLDSCYFNGYIEFVSKISMTRKQYELESML